MYISAGANKGRRTLKDLQMPAWMPYTQPGPIQKKKKGHTCNMLICRADNSLVVDSKWWLLSQYTN